MKHPYKNSLKGFTLVELSIVIIIIGLLIAGVSSGASLIKQAKLNSLVTSFTDYKTAYLTFVNKYNAIPGDMANAYAYWGASCGASANVCNGNGNGAIDASSADNPTADLDEVAAAWKHLSLANIISFTPPVVTDPPPNLIVGQNVPASNLNNGGFVMGSNAIPRDLSNQAYIWVNDAYQGYVQNTQNFVFAASSFSNYPTYLSAAILSARDAFSIDSKIDDGHIDSSGNFTGPTSGNFRVFQDFQFFGSANVCTNVFATQTNVYYAINGDEITCIPIMGLN